MSASTYTSPATSATTVSSTPSSTTTSTTTSQTSTVTPAPSNEAASILKGTIYTVQAGIHSITDAPATFHCGYCNTPLLTPTGPWQCQTCTTMNQPTDLSCTKCSQSLFDNKVLCGQCGKSTSVPRTGFHDATRSTIAAIQSGAKLAWNSITGTPHAECPRCGTSVALPKNFAAEHKNDTTMATVSCTQCHHSFPVGGQTLSSNGTGTGSGILSDHSSTLAGQQSAINTATASAPASSTTSSSTTTL